MSVGEYVDKEPDMGDYPYMAVVMSSNGRIVEVPFDGWHEMEAWVQGFTFARESGPIERVTLWKQQERPSPEKVRVVKAYKPITQEIGYVHAKEAGNTRATDSHASRGSA